MNEHISVFLVRSGTTQSIRFHPPIGNALFERMGYPDNEPKPTNITRTSERGDADIMSLDFQRGRIEHPETKIRAIGKNLIARLVDEFGKQRPSITFLSDFRAPHEVNEIIHRSRTREVY